jgi:hypothetical protein
MKRCLIDSHGSGEEVNGEANPEEGCQVELDPKLLKILLV